MKKNFIIIFIILICSGCSVNYTLDIDKEINEKIEIFETNPDLFESDIYKGSLSTELPYRMMINNEFSLALPVLSNQNTDTYDDKNEVEGTLYYDKELIDTDTKLGLNLNSKIDIYQIKYLNSIGRCYENISYTNYKGKLYIETSENNICFDSYPMLDELNIRLKTKYKVISSNATSKSDGEYFWNINRDNYQKQKIEFTLDLSSNDRLKNIFSFISKIFLGICCVCIVCGIIFVIVKIKGKSINKI